MFRIPTKFEGVNENGLTFEQFVEQDVKRYTTALSEWYDNKGNTTLVSPASWMDDMYEARVFMDIMHGLRCYYHKYLETLLAPEMAQILRSGIVDTVNKYGCQENLNAGKGLFSDS